MFPRLALAAALALSWVVVAGCASAPEQQAAQKSEKVYRTGSNLPVRDPSAPSEVKNARVDDTPMRTQLPSPRGL